VVERCRRGNQKRWPKKKKESKRGKSKYLRVVKLPKVTRIRKERGPLFSVLVPLPHEKSVLWVTK